MGWDRARGRGNDRGHGGQGLALYDGATDVAVRHGHAVAATSKATTELIGGDCTAMPTACTTDRDDQVVAARSGRERSDQPDSGPQQTPDTSGAENSTPHRPVSGSQLTQLRVDVRVTEVMPHIHGHVRGRRVTVKVAEGNDPDVHQEVGSLR